MLVSVLLMPRTTRMYSSVWDGTDRLTTRNPASKLAMTARVSLPAMLVRASLRRSDNRC